MRSSFGSSTLVRLLADWTPAEAEPSGLDVAERLSLWVNAFDAIRLQAGHQSIAGLRAAAPARMARAPALADDLQRVRSILAKAIAQEPGPVVETAHTPADLRRLARSVANPDVGAADAGYARWRQRHLELQRQMDLMIPPLREHVRHALAVHASLRLRQLAALDAVLEQVLAAREQKLLPTVAERMERRFAQLLAAHRQAVADSGQPDDDPAAWRRPGGWLEQFAREWRQLLAAELDLRLQPVTGLIEAFSKELDEQQ